MNEKETGMNSPRPAAPLKKKPPLENERARLQVGIFSISVFYTNTARHTDTNGRGGRGSGPGRSRGGLGAQGRQRPVGF